MRISLVIRTLNESTYLPALLQGVQRQRLPAGWTVECVLVDSGSTDGTVQIAQRFGCRIHTIRREEFSFGRSLNLGCEAAAGDILVFVSGHCVPTDEHWLARLCEPIATSRADYTYGRQIGGPTSRYSETRIFAKYFPGRSSVPQQGYYCNNANSALARSTWSLYRFNEELTGLEDMELARRLVEDGGLVGYVAEACVHHHHQESWAQVRRRFEREAIALRRIMPQVHVGLWDTVRYIASSVWLDLRRARREGQALRQLPGIVRYRWEQYLGAWRGHHQHRKLSRQEKEHYFFPDLVITKDLSHDEIQERRLAAHEGQQRAGARQELSRVLRQTAVPVDVGHPAGGPRD
ncbi:glycosyltransferase family 2 protein [Ideonella livida]|uniref:Glycosyltransferase n=1 Tax=Ideonella livida TaxID=2707176 RepID=A0A7C9TP43_9BURK|nr:glycosyltransferase [Ideonella livida]NDY93246.1 glycosyltransferase [Ideonella livida]